MKNRAIVLLMLPFASMAQDSTQVYSHPEYHYSIEIPSSWNMVKSQKENRAMHFMATSHSGTAFVTVFGFKNDKSKMKITALASHVEKTVLKEIELGSLIHSEKKTHLYGKSWKKEFHHKGLMIEKYSTLDYYCHNKSALVVYTTSDQPDSENLTTIRSSLVLGFPINPVIRNWLYILLVASLFFFASAVSGAAEPLTNKKGFFKGLLAPVIIYRLRKKTKKAKQTSQALETELNQLNQELSELETQANSRYEKIWPRIKQHIQVNY
ncbi:hypothetical protein GF406_12740 [candidate division KSB1 bacterium]|nr:hypothetical protein [candidate division KSB1 bacterium]